MFYPLPSDKIYCNNDSNELCLALQPTNNLSYFFKEFNFFLSDISNIPENITNSKY